MFDFVTKHKRLLQFVLALMIVPPFAFWGIQWTQRETAGVGEVASVGGQKISEQEFTEALRQQQERLRGMLGRNFDPALFDSPAMRRELLEGMISQRLMMQHAARNHLTVSNETLVETTRSIPAFQADGKFSRERYDAALRTERMSPEAFDAALRGDLLVQQLTGALADSGLASKAVSRQLAQLRAQQREIAEHRVQADALVAQAKITPEASRAFYDANPARFQVPEEVGVEYLVLSTDALLAAEQVGADEIKSYYESNLSKYGEPEQRRASHILIAVKSGAGDAEKAKARERAAQILSQLRKSPGSFAELAKNKSGDPGSASRGGDLGFFSRGMMVRAFEDAAFRLKPNQISDLVESDFGFHIIKITGIKAGKMNSLDAARPEIERELKKQRAGRRFAEAAEAFSNLVYEQSDSLGPAAERFKLAVQRAHGVTRQSAPVPALNNPRLLAALFADDSIRNRRNTEAVETAPGVLVSARVLDHKPASHRPFEEVKGDLGKQLAQQEALVLARRQGEERLKELKNGDASAVRFGTTRLVSRDEPRGLSPEALSRIFGADASKLPAYAGVESNNGYVIYRVTRVVDVEPDETRRRSVQSELGRAIGTQEFKSFLDGLRADAKVEINKAALEKKTQ
ncbi:MAG TPA: SurA N-terminal domain-containing protein [Burkholderiales bacterium]|nr:SurA N-terminal domain-containing protein [Burkholderiales bacterium]